jgi:putative transcriptional regulator
MKPPSKGSLLVAAPALEDPNFRRCVVLLLACDEDGALGVVLNRPGTTPVVAVAPTWVDHASPPGVLFTGGPVQQDAAICVGCQLEGEELAPADGIPAAVDGYAPVTSAFGTIDLHRDPEEVPVSLSGMRVYRGYAGWGSGQLDAEIEAKGWFVVGGYTTDVLTPEPEQLWQRVLERQGGWLSVLARHPLDPSLN